MLRYGLIGSGMMGQEHMRNVALLDGVEIAALADPNADMRAGAAALAGSAGQYCDWREMIAAETFDAFIVAAPNDIHHEILSALMPLGRPILCEKPLCTTSADCRDILALARGAPAPVWVAMEYRYMQPIQRLLQERDAGTAGPPKMMAVREHRYPFLSKVDHWNRFTRRTGGTMVEKCCHFWDLMRFVLQSDPVRVYASAGLAVNHLDERYDGETPDIFDHGFVVVDFASGARGVLDLCMFAEGSPWQETISLTGPKARIDAYVPGPPRFAADGAVHQARLAVCDRATRSERVEIVEVDPTILKAGDHHGSTYYQHRRFLDLVRAGGGTPEVTLEDGAWAVRVGEAAEHSARTGQSVELDGPF